MTGESALVVSVLDPLMNHITRDAKTSKNGTNRESVREVSADLLTFLERREIGLYSSHVSQCGIVQQSR